MNKRLFRLSSPTRRSIPSQFSWGFADQIFSSGTNLLVSLLAGRLVGPSGLGAITIALSFYFSLIGLERALVAEPLSVATTNSSREERARAAGMAASVVLSGSFLVAGAVGLLGLWLPGVLGRALLLAAPWLVLAPLQDLWRAVLFRDRRGRSAALNDVIWALFMALSLLLLWGEGSEWVVLAPWGLGASAAAFAGMVQTRTLPRPLGDSWRWWRRELWPLGRWLGGESLLLNLGGQIVPIELAAIAGASGVGGYQAVGVVFAPMTLIGQALELPGLPALVRALRHSTRDARQVALKLSASASLLVLLYTAAVTLLGPSRVLGWLFGNDFTRFAGLVLPLVLSQIVFAASTGQMLLLKALSRGGAILRARSFRLVTQLGGAALLGIPFGLEGAVWGLFPSTCVLTLMSTWMIRKQSLSRAAPGEQLSPGAKT